MTISLSLITDILRILEANPKPQTRKTITEGVGFTGKVVSSPYINEHINALVEANLILEIENQSGSRAKGFSKYNYELKESARKLLKNHPKDLPLQSLSPLSPYIEHQKLLDTWRNNRVGYR